MSTVAYQVYSNVKQQIIYDRPIEYHQIDFYKAKNKLQDLLKKYYLQKLKITYNEYEVKRHPEFIYYFLVYDSCHDIEYKVFLEKIEIFG